jgi:hypothetical protein
MRQIDRLLRLSGLIRQVKVSAAGAARARIAAIGDDLAAPGLHSPPEGADPAISAQHARWAAARRAALLADLAAARAELAVRTPAARRAVGIDGTLDRLAKRLAEERRRKARSN